jgi:murein DD-endopeptidase MepM/ murein hydrolase activator NlpD
MFAACATPLVIAEGGTVRIATSQARAGDYAVVTGAATGRDYVYMHMRDPALVKAGDTVRNGQPLGQVGHTGDVRGCHLHLEIWTAPGWQTGGQPIHPLPDIQAWDAQEPAHTH